MSNVKILWMAAAPTPDLFNRYLAVAHNATPFITIMDYTDQDLPVKITDPVALPTDSGRGADWRPRTNILCVPNNGTTEVIWYTLDSGLAVKLSDPATMPTNAGRYARWSPDGRYCAVGTLAGAAAQTWLIYDFTTGAPVEIGTVPAFTTEVTCLAWSKDSVFLMVNEFIYDITTGTPVLAHTLITTGLYVQADWSKDERYLCAMASSSPFIRFWDWNTGSPVLMSDPAALPPSTGRGCRWDLDDSRIITCAHGHVGGSPGNDSTRYDLTSGVPVAIADLNPEPSVSGAGSPRTVSYRGGNERLVVVSQQSTRIFVYDNDVSPPVGVTALTVPGGAHDSGWGGT